MTDLSDLSKRYQQDRKGSPKELDDQVLAAAKLQADKNLQAEENREPSNSISWLPFSLLPSNLMKGAAFACICMVGVLFVIDTDTNQLTDDIEFAPSTPPVPSQSSSDADSNLTFYEVNTDIGEAESGVQIEEVIVSARKRKGADEIKERRTMEIEKMKMEKNLSAKAEVARQISEDSFEPEQPESLLSAAPSRLEEGAMFEEVAVLNDSAAIKLDPELVDLAELIPGLILDIRYFGSSNFVGSPVDGYLAAKALMSEEAASALAKAQNAAMDRGLSLKVFDAYRPQRAVNHFVRWAEDLGDIQTKPVCYPNVEKSELFAKGYIAAKSGHSRASTVDLTLVDLATGQELDMGSPFDFFDPVSWPSSQAVSERAQQNRQLLRALMLDHGFKPYEAEWWHFTLENEPYPNQYFDIPVE